MQYSRAVFAEAVKLGSEGKHIVRAIKFLAMSGARIGTAAALFRSDIHLRNTIVFRRKTAKGKKRDIAVPMFPLETPPHRWLERYAHVIREDEMAAASG